MSMATNLVGRLRNTSLPAASGMLPLYEAVANSIHAIEDAGNEGRIRIEISRDGQTVMDFSDSKRRGREPKGDIIGFTVVDSGVGFTDENMQSFMTLDSEYKASRGGRGVGRLLWLKAFGSVFVESVYDQDGVRRKRTFHFTREGVSDPEVLEARGAARETVVVLSGFSKRYRAASQKTATAIARHLFEHCLWYFLRPGGAPPITIVDGDESISLDQVYDEHMVDRSQHESISVQGSEFHLVHVKLSASATRVHSIAFCAANRLVTREGIKARVPGLHGTLSDDGRDFVYECYVSSALLDERVRSERTGFDIDEDPLPLFESDELPFSSIRDAVLDRCAVFLAGYLEENRRLGKERVSSFVERRAPRYRPILARIPDDELAVDPGISDKDLELLLHKHLANLESRMLADGHDLLHPKDGELKEDYGARLRDYLATAEDIKKSDLANYVAHRRIILDLLEKAIRKQPSGKYSREELVHSLIMPMRTTSDEVHFDSCNLWLIDERLAFPTTWPPTRP